MPSGRSFEEEALPDKLNFGIWGRIGKYALRKWPLLLILLFTMLFTTFYDSSFVPMMNKAAYSAAGSFLSNAGSATSIWDVNFSVHFIFGFDLNLSFKGYIILFSVMILVRSFAIFGTFFLTNLIGMEIMTDLRGDTFHRIQELSFSYFDKTSSGWLIARMQNDTSSIGDVLSWGIIQIIWALFDFIFTLITMFFSNWILSVVVLASIPFVMII